MSSLKYIYDERNKTLETTEGVLFLDNNVSIAKFYSITQVFQYLKENDMSGEVGRRLDMDINNNI